MFYPAPYYFGSWNPEQKLFVKRQGSRARYCQKRGRISKYVIEDYTDSTRIYYNRLNTDLRI